MTTTKALAKLYTAITGSDAKNSIGRILSDLADVWSTKVPTAASVENAIKIPDLPHINELPERVTKYYVLKVVKSSSGTTYTWDEKTFT